MALVHPGNPTGVFLSAAEQAAVAELCASRGLPLISDEVFADYPLEEASPSRSRGGGIRRSSLVLVGRAFEERRTAVLEAGLDSRGRPRLPPPPCDSRSGAGGG